MKTDFSKLYEYPDCLFGVGSATFAGPALPSGAIQPSPETLDKDTGGYTRNQPIVGFGQLYCQGTGGKKSYGNFLLAPDCDRVEPEDAARASYAAEGTEEAKCYEYRVTLQNGISICVTPAHHSAIYAITYPAGVTPTLYYDIGRKLDIPMALQTGTLTVDPAKGIVTGGGRFFGNWNPSPWEMYTVLTTDTPAAEYGMIASSAMTACSEAAAISFSDEEEAPTKFGAYMRFAPKEEAQTILVKLAVSFVSIEKAKEHLRAEIPAFDYEAVRKAAQEVWNEKLGAILLDTEDDVLRRRIYTALYHTNIQPRDRTRDHGEWDDFYTIWDSWKTLFPMRTLFYPDNVGTLMESFVRRAHDSRSPLIMSDAYINGKEYAAGQGGNDIENVIVDAFFKQVPLPTMTWEDVYAAVRLSAEQMRTQGYVEKGWVQSSADPTVNGQKYSWRLKPGSATLGFAVNDLAVARMAAALGHIEDAKRYNKRAKNWLNIWNDQAESDGFYGFPQIPKPDGTFEEGYDCKAGSYNKAFYESTAWDASYLIHYDMDTLIEKMGGREEFTRRLYWACEHSIEYYNDDGGKEGYLNFTNEPSMQIPWLFCTPQIDRPELAAQTIKRVLDRYDIPDDYPGDEDNGAISSYLLFLLLGFFPFSTTNDYYLHGARIPSVTLRLGNGKHLVIRTENCGADNIYLRSASWNGEPLSEARMTYDMLMEGGTLDFVMSDTPVPFGT